jgi:uracil phosphoribosyltransferase
MENVFQSTHPLVAHKLNRLRDKTTDSKNFRQIIRELSVLLAYEATIDLLTEKIEVVTPLAITSGFELKEQVGLIPILRAGLGMVSGVHELIPSAEVWHIGLYRDEKTLQPVQYYNKLPVAPTVQVCLILDPMLATGGSAAATVDILKRWGATKIKFMGILAAPEGISALHKSHPDVQIYIAKIDECLNENGYIMPGLGDAGDRQFGTA